MALEIWHNPRCGKSRAALAMIRDAGVDVRVRCYLEDPPTVEEIEGVLQKLGAEPVAITRTGDKRARELGLDSGSIDRDEWIATLATHPALIQRPIVVSDDGRALVARPPERVEALL